MLALIGAARSPGGLGAQTVLGRMPAQLNRQTPWSRERPWPATALICPSITILQQFLRLSGSLACSLRCACAGPRPGPIGHRVVPRHPCVTLRHGARQDRPRSHMAPFKSASHRIKQGCTAAVRRVLPPRSPAASAPRSFLVVSDSPESLLVLGSFGASITRDPRGKAQRRVACCSSLGTRAATMR
jgi:hypothetical protein